MKKKSEVTSDYLEKVYKNQYGEYKYIAGQVFVFKKGDIANKTLRILYDENIIGDRPSLKIRSRSVYPGDSKKVLQSIIEDWSEEWDWYMKSYGSIPGLYIPEEEYTICLDPAASDNLTIMVSVPWVDNIIGDIFRLDSLILHKYLTDYPNFKNSIMKMGSKYIEDAKIDIYPDFYGIDNVAVYLESDVPKIALIDPHIVYVGSKCDDRVKARLDRVESRFQRFIEDPLKSENIEYLTSDGLI